MAIRQKEGFFYCGRYEAGEGRRQADAFVSAGSSGAVLVGGQVIVGRIKGRGETSSVHR